MAARCEQTNTDLSSCPFRARYLKSLVAMMVVIELAFFLKKSKFTFIGKIVSLLMNYLLDKFCDVKCNT